MRPYPHIQYSWKVILASWIGFYAFTFLLAKIIVNVSTPPFVQSIFSYIALLLALGVVALLVTIVYQTGHSYGYTKGCEDTQSRK